MTDLLNLKAPKPIVPPYATYIPTRSEKAFKPHKTLGHAKNALLGHFEPFRVKCGEGRWDYQYGPDGEYTEDMILYRLNEDKTEYEVWIEIKKGDVRSTFPDLMPKSKR